MNTAVEFLRRLSFSVLSLAFVSILVQQPIAVFAAPLMPAEPPAIHRNVRQALNRLTFGARPGDFDAVPGI